MKEQEGFLDNPVFLFSIPVLAATLILCVAGCVGGMLQESEDLKELKVQGCTMIVKEYRTGRPVCADKEKL